MAKPRKVLKKLLIIPGSLLVLLIAAAILIPYFFKDDLLLMGKAFANEQINAELDFDEKATGLSIFHDFPNVSFSIEELTITGKEEFEGKKLADIGQFYFTVNIMDIINGNYTINGIMLDDADFYVKVLKNGKANYDIAKPSTESTTDTTTTTSSSSDGELSLAIDHWEINNLNLIYDDEPGGMYVEINDLDHSGSGDFSASLVDLATETSIEQFTVQLGNARYLRKAKIGVDFNANLDLANQVYTLKDNSFRINALELNADGSVRLPKEKDVKLDLKFNAPKTSFASILSLVPAAYTADFDDVKTKGKVQLDAFVKGIYNDKRLPAFAVNLAVDDAEVQYPDLPLPIKNINTKLAVNSPSSDLDEMTVQIPRFHIELGNNPFDATLNLKTPISDPDVQTTVNGTIDLEQLQQAFPMEGVSKLTGIIKANLDVDTRLSYVDKKQYDKVKTAGSLSVKGMNYNTTDLPPVKVNNLEMQFNPKSVNLADFDFNIGNSDLKGQGKLDNLMAYFSRNSIMRGKLKLNSNYFDANQILNAGGDTEEAAAEEEVNERRADQDVATRMDDTTTASTPMFEDFEFDLEADMKAIRYDNYNIVNVVFDGDFSPSKANLSNFEMLIGKVDIRARGMVENVFGYLFNEEKIKGSLTLYSNYMNLNQFMTEDGSAPEPEPSDEPIPDDVEQIESELEPIQVPANIDFTLFTTFKRLLYDNYDLKNVQAEVHIYDQMVDIVALHADAFGGEIVMNGLYNTQNPEEPKFAFGYDVKRLNIQEIVRQVGLSEKFVPILKSVYGNFNSEFKIEGDLLNNMYPDMASIVSKGVFETFDTKVRNSAGLKQLGEKLNMNSLKQLDLGNTVNFFTIEDGRLKVDPASYQVNGMDVILGGSHGLDNTMDYDMKLRVPRELLAQSPVGSAVNGQVDKGLAALSPQAQKLGLDLKESEYVNLQVDILGTVTKPKFKVNLLGAEGAGGNLGQQVTNTIKDEAQKVKDEMEAKAKAEADRLKAEAQAHIDAEKQRLKAEAEERARKLAQQAASNPQGAIDSLKNTNIQDVLKGGDKPKIDPNKLGDVFKSNDDKKGEDKKNTNPFGGFKNPFKK
jgi:uncharacterized protein involved in outer membrane biogenesis